MSARSRAGNCCGCLTMAGYTLTSPNFKLEEEVNSKGSGADKSKELKQWK